MIINSKNNYLYFQIIIDDLIHIQFIKELYIGHQSWKENSTKFCVEYYFKEGNSILSEYTDIYKWSEILKLLEKEL